MTEFSDFIKEKRANLNWTKSKLAKSLDVSFVTIWRWENGLSEPEDRFIDFWKKKIGKLKNE